MVLTLPAFLDFYLCPDLQTVLQSGCLQIEYDLAAVKDNIINLHAFV